MANRQERGALNLGYASDDIVLLCKFLIEMGQGVISKHLHHCFSLQGDT